MSGTLHLVGVGPGDPELLTLKAVRVLGAADVIAYPRKQGEASMALGIARAHLRADATHVPVDIPMAVERAPAQAAYDRLAAAVLEHLGAGRHVAYLCEGDPLLYGSAIYLMARIAGRAPIVVIPGVTSLTASAAAACRPLCARNEVLKVLPAPLPDDRLRAELAGAEAVAIVKPGRHLGRVRALLAETGHAAGAVVVEHASGETERVTRLEDFSHSERPYFATILCRRGEVAGS